jgi:hypothetical protein
MVCSPSVHFRNVKIFFRRGRGGREKILKKLVNDFSAFLPPCLFYQGFSFSRKDAQNTQRDFAFFRFLRLFAAAFS